MGQFGILFSGGMYQLASKIKALSTNIKCTLHSWDSIKVISDAVSRLPTETKIVLVGYSLGANSIIQIAERTAQHIDLLVGYDPSLDSPSPDVQKVPANVKKALAYENSAALLGIGGAKYEGKQVIHVPIAENHLAVCWDQSLHKRTCEAISHLL